MDKKKYILNEIEELNKEHKKIQKSQIWWLIGALVGLVFFPITIGVIIVMILNARKMSKIREQIKEKQREVDMADIEHDTYKKQEEKKQPLKHEQKKKTEPKMNKKIQKKLLIAIVGIILFSIVLIVLFGDSWEEANEKQRILTEQAQPQSGTGGSGIQLDCPKQGWLQSDWSYCVDLCIHDKGDDEYKTITKCENYCRIFERADDRLYTSGLSPHILQDRIEKYKCELCGECTEEQLKKIEEKEREKEEAEIAYQKNIEEAKIKKEEEQRIKEEQLKIQEQERLELEKKINSQSEKLDGYVYIKNKSGESRQFEENGIIYEFSYPAKEPTKVPVDLGKRLLTTGQFELVIV